MTTRDRTNTALSLERTIPRDASYDPAQSPFQNRRIAITGGSSGLGLALVRELLRRGAHVGFVARKPDGVKRVLDELGRAFGVVGDVSKKEDIHPIALQLLAALGGLDILINNASDLGPVPLQLLADTECEDLERALATNVLGPFRLTKALLGSLAASAREGRGTVVLNVSSDAAINPYARWGAYAASKAALHHLTRVWEQELSASGIYFLSMDPGDMDTAMHAAAVPDADPSTLKRPETDASLRSGQPSCGHLNMRRRSMETFRQATGWRRIRSADLLDSERSTRCSPARTSAARATTNYCALSSEANP